MVQQVSFGDFTAAFRSTGRQDQFSYQGLRALYDYLEAWEEDTGEPVDFNVVAICYDFQEYATWKEFSVDYSEIQTMEELQDSTTVIPLDASEGFIIQAF